MTQLFLRSAESTPVPLVVDSGDGAGLMAVLLTSMAATRPVSFTPRTVLVWLTAEMELAETDGTIGNPALPLLDTADERAAPPAAAAAGAAVAAEEAAAALALPAGEPVGLSSSHAKMSGNRPDGPRCCRAGVEDTDTAPAAAVEACVDPEPVAAAAAAIAATCRLVAAAGPCRGGVGAAAGDGAAAPRLEA